MPRLTKDELTQATRAYLEHGTFEAAAKVIGRDASSVRRALLRRGVDSSLDAFALQLERVEWTLLQAVQSVTENAKNLSQWASRPSGTPGHVTIDVQTLRHAMEAAGEATALVTKLSLATERRKLQRARRRLTEEETRTLRAAREQAAPPERVRVVNDGCSELATSQARDGLFESHTPCT